MRMSIGTIAYSAYSDMQCCQSYWPVNSSVDNIQSKADIAARSAQVLTPVLRDCSRRSFTSKSIKLRRLSREGVEVLACGVSADDVAIA